MYCIMILPKAEIRTRSRMRCRFCRVNFTIASRNIIVDPKYTKIL